MSDGKYLDGLRTGGHTVADPYRLLEIKRLSFALQVLDKQLTATHIFHEKLREERYANEKEMREARKMILKEALNKADDYIVQGMKVMFFTQDLSFTSNNPKISFQFEIVPWRLHPPPQDEV